MDLPYQEVIFNTNELHEDSREDVLYDLMRELGIDFIRATATPGIDRYTVMLEVLSSLQEVKAGNFKEVDFDLEGLQNIESAKAVYPTGSFYTCEPKVTTTDKDYLVYVTDIVKAMEYLGARGWTPCFHEYHVGNVEQNWGSDWYAFRRERTNENVDVILIADLVLLDLRYHRIGQGDESTIQGRTHCALPSGKVWKIARDRIHCF